MKFTIFANSLAPSNGQLLTADGFNQALFSEEVGKRCDLVRIGDPDEEGLLPAVTWGSYFPDGIRLAEHARLSGLYPLRITQLENATKTWNRIIAHRKDFDIVTVYSHPTGTELLLVAKNRPDFPESKSIETNQRWLTGQLESLMAKSGGMEGSPVIDGDPCRAYPLYTHAYLLFQAGEVFEVGDQQDYACATETPNADPTTAVEEDGQQTRFRGIPLKEIAKAWIEANVGEPAQGQYTNLVYNLAMRLRHICEYQPTVIAEAVPHFDLSQEAVMKECSKACSAARSSMPTDLKDVIDRLAPAYQHGSGTGEEERPVDFEADAQEGLAQFLDTSQMPPLPPVIKQYVETAPEGFEQAAALCMLPILGTVGSRLRAHYITRHNMAPTFMVCLVGEQSSGKSFISDAAEMFLVDVQKADDAAEEEISDYKKTMKKLSATKSKVSKKDIDSVIPDEPTPIIRIIEPKVTQPALLKIMVNNENLHCITVAPEIDTVRKSLSTNHGNISDFLRQAFDNVRYGQQTACDTSFSGHVTVFYNTVYSGTPEAVRKFFNSETQENGLMSRFILTTLPYDPFELRDVWKEFTPNQKKIIDQGLKALNDITVRSYALTDKDGVDHVQYEAMPEYQMEMPWLNTYIAEWGATLREKAKKAKSVNHAKFHLRCGVVGFRAGMLAWFLYGEKKSSKVKKDVCEFAVWVANSMLNGLVENYEDESDKRASRFGAVYNLLPDVFTRSQLEEALRKAHQVTPITKVLAIWRKIGAIDPTQKYTAPQFNKKF